MIRTAAPAVAMLAIFWCAPAKADPCEGALPAYGASFSGTVRYIGDGDMLCVEAKGHPDQWIEVRLGDFYAPELHERGGEDAKRRLIRLTMGRTVICRAGRRSYDRIVAYCTLDGQPLGELLRANGGREGGRGWRR